MLQKDFFSMQRKALLGQSKQSMTEKKILSDGRQLTERHSESHLLHWLLLRFSVVPISGRDPKLSFNGNSNGTRPLHNIRRSTQPGYSKPPTSVTATHCKLYDWPGELKTKVPSWGSQSHPDLLVHGWHHILHISSERSELHCLRTVHLWMVL